MILRAKDLRIGNILEDYDERIIKVMPNDILALYQTEIAATDNIIYFPVEITIDWLERLGFEKRKGYVPDNWFYMYKFNRKYLYNTASKMFCIEEDKNYNSLPFNVEYVHQLQNVYYAHTMIDLECVGF